MLALTATSAAFAEPTRTERANMPVTDAYQASKQVVRNFYEALEGDKGKDVAAVLAAHVTDDFVWRGTHPFNEQVSVAEVTGVFWAPFLHAFSSVQRRQDIFIAGSNSDDGAKSEWVCSMGRLLGLFDHDWLGIPATRKMASLRYVEFHRVEGGKIA